MIRHLCTKIWQKKTRFKAISIRNLFFRWSNLVVETVNMARSRQQARKSKTKKDEGAQPPQEGEPSKVQESKMSGDRNDAKENDGSDGGKLTKKRRLDNPFCEICSIEVDRGSLRQHNKGKRHTKRLKERDSETSPSSVEVQATTEETAGASTSATIATADATEPTNEEVASETTSVVTSDTVSSADKIAADCDEVHEEFAVADKEAADVELAAATTPSETLTS